MKMCVCVVVKASTANGDTKYVSKTTRQKFKVHHCQ